MVHTFPYNEAQTGTNTNRETLIFVSWHHIVLQGQLK